MKRFVVFLFGIFLSAISYADTCTQSQIDLGNGECVDTKFFVSTSVLSSDDKFKFNISASGIFYVDCGTDGVLESENNDIQNKTITRTDTDNILYTCTYTTGGTKTIRFAGLATGYDTGNSTAAISFYKNATPEKVASIDGSLGTIFSTLGQNNGEQPRFNSTFRTTKITTIPSGLFSGITGSIGYMFEATFCLCKNLKSIPENLFQNITASNHLFMNTFQECTSLKTIPSGLFSNITNPAQWMFAFTFYRCMSLTTVPENLFHSINGVANDLFRGTFYGCSSLNYIPEGLFSNINGSANSLFYNTFRGCINLKTIPENLFSGVNSSANYMFEGTFKECSKITQIPAGLFRGVSGASGRLFFETFSGCSQLSGVISPSLFSGLIKNNSPTATNMWTDIFKNTNLDTTCPTGKTQYITGYEDYWDGKVSCVDETFVCDAGEYFPAHGYQCETCPTNSFCVGETYNYSETVTQGLQSCASGTFAPTGSAVCYPHILHVGDSNVYLKSTKQTTPSLNFRIGNDIFYANMTTTRTKMNKDSDHYFHAQWADNHYYVCDDTTCPNGE